MKKTLFLFLVYLLVFCCMLSSCSAENGVSLTVAEEQLAPGPNGYAFLNANHFASSAAVESALKIKLGSKTEAEYEPLGFTRAIYDHPQASLDFLGTPLQLEFEFRNDQLWCVTGKYPLSDCETVFRPMLDQVMKALGKAEYIVMRDAASNEMGLQSEAYRWTADIGHEQYLSSLVLQISGKNGAWETFSVGWMLVDPETMVTK